MIGAALSYFETRLLYLSSSSVLARVLITASILVASHGHASAQDAEQCEGFFGQQFTTDPLNGWPEGIDAQAVSSSPILKYDLEGQTLKVPPQVIFQLPYLGFQDGNLVSPLLPDSDQLPIIITVSNEEGPITGEVTNHPKVGLVWMADEPVTDERLEVLVEYAPEVDTTSYLDGQPSSLSFSLEVTEDFLADQRVSFEQVETKIFPIKFQACCDLEECVTNECSQTVCQACVTHAVKLQANQRFGVDVDVDYMYGNMIGLEFATIDPYGSYFNKSDLLLVNFGYEINLLDQSTYVLSLDDDSESLACASLKLINLLDDTVIQEIEQCIDPNIFDQSMQFSGVYTRETASERELEGIQACAEPVNLDTIFPLSEPTMAAGSESDDGCNSAPHRTSHLLFGLLFLAFSAHRLGLKRRG